VISNFFDSNVLLTRTGLQGCCCFHPFVNINDCRKNCAGYFLSVNLRMLLKFLEDTQTGVSTTARTSLCVGLVRGSSCMDRHNFSWHKMVALGHL
jgi:hypothetical protein